MLKHTHYVEKVEQASWREPASSAFHYTGQRPAQGYQRPLPFGAIVKGSKKFSDMIPVKGVATDVRDCASGKQSEFVWPQLDHERGLTQLMA